MSISEIQYRNMLQRTAPKEAEKLHAPSDEPESTLHYAILDYCRGKGWLCVHSRMDRRTTTAVGISDFIIVAPQAVWFIECKRPGQKLRPEQAAFRAQILKLGWPHATVHSMAEFLQAVEPKQEQPHHD